MLSLFVTLFIRKKLQNMFPVLILFDREKADLSWVLRTELHIMMELCHWDLCPMASVKCDGYSAIQKNLISDVTAEDSPSTVWTESKLFT